MSALLPAFRLERPHEVEAAVALRVAGADSRYLAGGTDLIVNLRRGLGSPAVLVDLAAIEELGTLELGPSQLRIGAGVTLAALTACRSLELSHAALRQAAGAIAGPSHRNLATVGGNLCLDTRCIYYNQSEWWRRASGYCLKHGGEVCRVAPEGQRCHAAFSGDLAPALLALGAELEIAGPAGRRRIPLGDLYVEDGRAPLALAPAELLVAVYTPAKPAPSAYAKVRIRGAMDFPLAGVAVALRCERGRLSELRVALTGTNSRPFLLGGTEACLGALPDEATLRRLEKLVQTQVKPMRTTLTASNYRRLAATALVRRLVAQLATAAASAS